MEGSGSAVAELQWSFYNLWKTPSIHPSQHPTNARLTFALTGCVVVALAVVQYNEQLGVKCLGWSDLLLQLFDWL